MLKRNNLKNDKIYPSIVNNGNSKFVWKNWSLNYINIHAIAHLKINCRVKKYLSKKQHPDSRYFFFVKLMINKSSKYKFINI